MKRSARPTTARRRPPKVKEGAQELQVKDIAPQAKKTTGIIIDGVNDDEDDDGIPDETNNRLADEFKADAKGDTNGVSNPGNPQSKLVKDIMSRQAEQDAAARAGAKNEGSEETKNFVTDAQGSGIRLGKLRKTGTS